MKFILSHNNDIQSIDTCRFCITYQRHILAANSIFIRRQRKQTKMVQWKILQLWDDYANNKITASHLLKKCGNLYTPGV